MNWRRGFFRLWAALSVAWAVFLYINSNPGHDIYTKAITDLPRGSGVIVPLSASSDEIRTELLAYYREMAPTQKFEEAQIASDEALVRAEINRTMARNQDNRRYQWRELVTWSIVVPAAVLGLGVVVAWILSGFRARTTRP